MHARPALLCVAVLSLVAGCPAKGSPDGARPGETASPLPTTAPTSTTVLTPEPGTKGGIDPRVKGELDGRADGITGPPLAVAGAQASLESPAGWHATNGAFTVAASPDKKAQIAAGAFSAAEGPAGKLAAAEKALGLAGCTWAATDAIALGKGKLAATAADGLCSRGAAQIHTAYVAPSAEGLLVMGAWDADGDSASVFGAMRSIAKGAVGGGDATGIAACCAALHGNAKLAPPEQQAGILAAASVCDAVKNSPQGRAVLVQVRAALAGASVPSSCR